MIELLRFDSRRPSLKYGFLVDLLQSRLAKVPVIVRAQEMWQPRQVQFERSIVGPLVSTRPSHYFSASVGDGRSGSAARPQVR